MAVVAVYRPRVAVGSDAEEPYRHPGAGRKGAHPKMRIIAEGGNPFEVPYAPRGGELGGVTPEFNTVARGGREPMLLRAGGSLVTYSFELVLGHPNPQVSIDKELWALRRLAESGKRMRVKLDSTTARYLWRITSFTAQTLARQHGTNAPTRAVVNITLTQASDPSVNVGPVSGGKRDDDDRGGNQQRPKFYVVKKGDTLQEIAKRFYGKASLWRRLADAQEPKIRHPKKLKVGRRLRLPALQGVGSAASLSVGD